jgi:hypothetical protein
VYSGFPEKPALASVTSEEPGFYTCLRSQRAFPMRRWMLRTFL